MHSSILVGCGETENLKGSNALEQKKGQVTFSGGYETDPRDRGRPIVLIAAGLNVTSEVFRDAFSRVNPAQDGMPSEAHAQANKKVPPTAKVVGHDDLKLEVKIGFSTDFSKNGSVTSIRVVE